MLVLLFLFLISPSYDQQVIFRTWYNKGGITKRTKKTVFKKDIYTSTHDNRHYYNYK